MFTTLTFLQLVIAALGAARITSLIVFDDLLEPIRHRVFLWSPPLDDVDRGLVYQGYGASRRSAGFVGSLLSCYHCVGVWVAAAVYTGVSIAPTIIVPILTVAAIAQISDTAIKASR